MRRKYDAKKFVLEIYNYNLWFESEGSSDTITKKLMKKNRLIQQKLMKNLLIYQQCNHQKMMKNKKERKQKERH